ncbi:oxidoreductase [Chryseomicrobium excrementi]|uniref:Oxidoreductase n=1 Tax=Chryseomicrobium excrementi TaxID=2041346 RepID=A0A2M9F2W7_9BACL|nr:aldo/keto reductase [Chryseomicrobium excrementi]PJK17812.1 oxidoreductase [Chryseomicrobium excrementi]
MKTQRLGKSTLQISELSLGGMSFPKEQNKTDTIIQHALEQGINWIDTADLYEQGENETRIGKSLQGIRSDVHISTKVGNRFTAGKQGWTWDPDPKWIEQAVEGSLKRLNTDYIDLYQLHGGTKEDDWDGIIAVFERLREQGKIREYGISSIRPNVIYPYFEKSQAVSVMMQYSALDRRAESVFPFLEEHEVGLLVRGGQAKGLLTDAALEKLEKHSQYGSYDESTLEQTVKQMHQSMSHLGATSLAHILSQPAVSSVVIGTSSLEQLKDTLNNYKTTVSNEDVEQLVALSKQETYKEHVE